MTVGTGQVGKVLKVLNLKLVNSKGKLINLKNI